MNNENKKVAKQRYFPLFLFPFFILHFSLFICSCDLFDGSAQLDYLAKIDEEIAWSNAEKLTVTIAYPNAWGVSNPGAGLVNRSILDIRQGFVFDVEFTPDPAYSLLGWRVYETAAITPEVLNPDEPEKGDWRTNTNLLNEVEQITGVEVPEIPETGGSGSFIINTTMPLTLVPWCKTEPRVIRTEPRNEGESGGGNSVHPSTPIVIYFNSALNDRQDLSFGEDKINIKARPGTDTDVWVDYSNRFVDPVYDTKFGQYFITVAPKVDNLPQAGYQIQVTVGPDIFNAENEPMSREEVFYYSISSGTGGNASVSGWSATYNEAAGTITVNYNLAGTNASSAPLRAYYQMNQGVSLPISLSPSGTTRTGTISGVSGLDFSGVRDGGNVSGSREYRIFMELGTGVDTIYDNFKIWNFPGMSVSNDNQAIELRQAAELAAIPTTGLGRQYVLANDITIPSNTPHSPINNFTGKFYGNGKTVTINSINAAAEMGLFGIANNTVIRDLTVQYSGSVSPTTAFRFGGIAGTTQGNTQLINVLVKGSVTIGGSGNTAYAGGLVGLMTGTSSINNAYGGLKLTVNTNPGTSNSLYVGGIAGSMGRPDNGDPVRVEGATVVGDITVGNTAQINTFSFVLNQQNQVPGNDTQGAFVGGLAGFVRGTGAASRASLLDSRYRQGTILIRLNTGSAFLGGAVGDAFNFAEISDCHALGGFDITKTAGFTAFSVGGFIGYADANVTVNSCSSSNSVAINSSATSLVDGAETYVGGFVGKKNAAISYCYAKGDVSIGSYGGVFVGGFLGYTSTSGTTSYCYATGNVGVVSSGDGRTFAGAAQEIIVGGFSGYSAGGAGLTSNCYALGDVFVSKVSGTGTVYGGGFAGQITSGASYCFAKGKVIAQRTSSNTVNAGGFAGRFQGSNVAAFGESVTVTGGNPRNIGRIYGTITGTPSNNRAYNGMRLYSSATYGDSRPAEITTLDPYPEANNQHGANTNLGDFRTRSFWTNLGFTTANWDHVTVESRGYPILRGIGGQ